MAYADYNFYITQYNGGKLSHDEFCSLIVKASAVLDELTFDRIRNVTDDISMAACAIADVMHKYECSGASNGIASESIGDLSINYRSDVTADSPAASESYRRAAHLFVKDKNLFYRGR